MTAYEKLVQAEQAGEYDIQIREKTTGKEGVAGTNPDGVAVFYGAEDGSDDKTITPEEFNRDFEITAIIPLET